MRTPRRSLPPGRRRCRLAAAGALEGPAVGIVGGRSTTAATRGAPDHFVATHKGATRAAAAPADGTPRVADHVLASPSGAQPAAIGVAENGWRRRRSPPHVHLVWLGPVRDEPMAAGPPTPSSTLLAPGGRPAGKIAGRGRERALRSSMMKVEVLYFDGCPNHGALLPHLRDLVRSVDAGADIELVRVEDADAAERKRFLGSPTVRVDGEDVEPGATERTDFGLKCRLFATPDGLRGVPADEWVLAALQRALTASR